MGVTHSKADSAPPPMPDFLASGGAPPEARQEDAPEASKGEVCCAATMAVCVVCQSAPRRPNSAPLLGAAQPDGC